MNEGMAKVFELLSGWREYSHFETHEEGHITHERVGDGSCFFFWGVDKEPVKLDAMFIDGYTFVRYSNNAH
jgi:hypothetical protein